MSYTLQARQLPSLGLPISVTDYEIIISNLYFYMMSWAFVSYLMRGQFGIYTPSTISQILNSMHSLHLIYTHN